MEEFIESVLQNIKMLFEAFNISTNTFVIENSIQYHKVDILDGFKQLHQKIEEQNESIKQLKDMNKSLCIKIRNEIHEKGEDQIYWDFERNKLLEEISILEQILASTKEEFQEEIKLLEHVEGELLSEIDIWKEKYHSLEQQQQQVNNNQAKIQEKIQKQIYQEKVVDLDVKLQRIKFGNKNSEPPPHLNPQTKIQRIEICNISHPEVLEKNSNYKKRLSLKGQKGEKSKNKVDHKVNQVGIVDIQLTNRNTSNIVKRQASSVKIVQIPESTSDSSKQEINSDTQSNSFQKPKTKKQKQSKVKRKIKLSQSQSILQSFCISKSKRTTPKNSIKNRFNKLLRKKILFSTQRKSMATKLKNSNVRKY